MQGLLQRVTNHYGFKQIEKNSCSLIKPHVELQCSQQEEKMILKHQQSHHTTSSSYLLKFLSIQSKRIFSPYYTFMTQQIYYVVKKKVRKHMKRHLQNDEQSQDTQSQQQRPIEYKKLKSYQSNLTDQQYVVTVQKSQYKQKLKDCRKHQKLFTDQQFPPVMNIESYKDLSPKQYKSLGSKRYLENQIKQHYDLKGWKRISQIIQNPVFVKDGYSPNDVLQGRLGNCYFLAAVSSFASSFNRVMKKLFVWQKFSKYGIYAAKFFIRGIQVEVVVDDYIPVCRIDGSDQNGKPHQKWKPMYGKSTTKNQIWPMILQKAWAKLYGSYENINGGQAFEALYALTGAPFSTKFFETKSLKETKQTTKNIDKYRNDLEMIQTNIQKLNKFITKKNGIVCFEVDLNDIQPKSQASSEIKKPRKHVFSVIRINNQNKVVTFRDPRGQYTLKKQTVEKWRKNALNLVFKDYKKQQIDQKLIHQKLPQQFVSLMPGQYFARLQDLNAKAKAFTVCQMKPNFNKISRIFQFQRSLPRYFTFQLCKSTQLIISISQHFKDFERKPNGQKLNSSQYSVSSLVLAKLLKNDKNQQKYEFVAARLGDNLSSINFLKVQMAQPGNYIFFALIHWNFVDNESQPVKQATISIDSQDVVEIEPLKVPYRVFKIQTLFYGQQGNGPSQFLNLVMWDYAWKSKKPQYKGVFKSQDMPDLEYRFRSPKRTQRVKLGGLGYFCCLIDAKVKRKLKITLSQRQLWCSEVVQLVDSHQANQRQQIIRIAEPGKAFIMVFIYVSMQSQMQLDPIGYCQWAVRLKNIRKKQPYLIYLKDGINVPKLEWV